MKLALLVAYVCLLIGLSGAIVWKAILMFRSQRQSAASQEK
jgi:hypothetical protein